MNPTTSAPRSATLDSDGATIAYDVRSGADEHPALLLIGSPMDAGGFPTLAGHFTDRTVITYDPRGVSRSTTPDPTAQSTPEQHAEDLRRVIEAAGNPPVDVFASSGGAVNALALVSRQPGLVRTLVAHEPPLIEELADRSQAWAAVLTIRDAYEAEGLGPGMTRFIALVQHTGPVPDGYAAAPGPDPATFGLPTEDDGNRTDPLLRQNLLTCTGYRVDVEALRAAATRVVIGVGESSAGELAHRAGAALAGRMGMEPTVFPGDHAGFLGGEYGMVGEPDAFAARLRVVLDR